MRSKTSSFVVTFSALAACTPQKSSGPPTPEPAATTTTPVPEPEPQPIASAPEREPEPVKTAEPQPERENLSSYPNVTNPRDANGRVIHKAWQGNDCFVELPFGPLLPGQQRPPGTAPPTQKVACPAPLQDPAYEQCRGGIVHQKPDKSACVCFIMGNPPPVPKRIKCPS